MFNLSAKKFYLINSFTGFQNIYNTKVADVEVSENNLIIDMRVNPSSLDFDSLSDRIYTTVTYNLLNDTFTIKCEGKGSRKYNAIVKHDTTNIINHLVSEAHKQYKTDCTEVRLMTAVYFHNELSKVTNDTAILNELDYKVCHEELSVSALHAYVINKLNELQPAEQTETTNNNEINNIKSESFTVGNLSFSTYSEAEAYCLQSDFDPSVMITKEVVPLQPFNIQATTDNSEPIHPLYDYKDMFYFNSYDPCKLTEKQRQADINKHNTMYFKLKELDTIDAEQIQTLVDNNYSFWIEVANNNPYKRSDMYMIKITLSYMNKSFPVYIDKLAFESFIQSNSSTPSKALQPA